MDEVASFNNQINNLCNLCASRNKVWKHRIKRTDICQMLLPVYFIFYWSKITFYCWLQYYFYIENYNRRIIWKLELAQTNESLKHIWRRWNRLSMLFVLTFFQSIPLQTNFKFQQFTNQNKSNTLSYQKLYRNRINK